MKDSQLEAKAVRVLKANRRMGYTLPSAKIYPFQWKWDSGFVAVGSTHFDIQWAMLELKTLLSAQWSNGFIPHIVFHDLTGDETYFPNYQFYNSSLSPFSNKSFKTTTLTQPPVEGWVLERIYNKGLGNKEIIDFVKRYFFNIYKQHEYLYNYRDPNDEGLVYIQHNWESGTDNSPVWDEIWESFDVPHFDFQRKDTSIVNEEQRPKKREYDYYLYLIDLFKKFKYQDDKIAQESPFLVQDPLFNSMLAASNNSLIFLAKEFGFQLEYDKLMSWNEKTKFSLNTKLYDELTGIYRYYDLRNNKWLNGHTISGFAPLFAGIPTLEQTEKMLSTLYRFTQNGRLYSVPSFPPDDDRFESQRYWRGPVWVNMNWIIIEGLKGYGYLENARQIRNDTLQMVEEQGFYEYFEPDRIKSKNQKQGYGGASFSWTAALIIDLLNNSI